MLFLPHAATHDPFIANFLESVSVKEFLKSVKIQRRKSMVCPYLIHDVHVISIKTYKFGLLFHTASVVLRVMSLPVNKNVSTGAVS